MMEVCFPQLLINIRNNWQFLNVHKFRIALMMDFGTNKVLVSGERWLGKTLVYCLLNGIKLKNLQRPNNKINIKCAFTWEKIRIF